jgi:hypothetical protein
LPDKGVTLVTLVTMKNPVSYVCLARHWIERQFCQWCRL